jgi:hypothetical protein
MKFVVAFAAPVAALRMSDAHPTVNMVLTNDGAMDANAFSLAQSSKSKSLRGELMDLVKSEEGRNHASLAEVAGDFHEPNVIRINYETPHAMLAQSQGIIRESVSSDSPYEEGEIGLNLIPAGAGSAASLQQLMAKADNEFETEFRAGLHKSFLEGPAIRIRLPRGGLKEETQSLLSDDGRIAVRVLPARRIPGGFNELASMIEASGEKSEAAVGELLSLFAQGKISKSELQQSGAVSRCADVMKSEGSSDAMRGGCGSVITHLTNTPVASSIMDSATGGAGHVTVVLPSPSRVYGA